MCYSVYIRLRKLFLRILFLCMNFKMIHSICEDFLHVYKRHLLIYRNLTAVSTEVKKDFVTLNVWRTLKVYS